MERKLYPVYNHPTNKGYFIGNDGHRHYFGQEIVPTRDRYLDNGKIVVDRGTLCNVYTELNDNPYHSGKTYYEPDSIVWIVPIVVAMLVFKFVRKVW
jgi:hypothetical protein